MIWQQPWAWVGSSLLAVPILIHLLGSGRSHRHLFPSLRFIGASRLLPSRRTRIHDPLLLLLRILILMLAVAALAQPWFATTGRRSQIDARLARVVIVDTSASVIGMETDSVLSAALSAWIDSLTSSVTLAMVTRTASPGAAIPGAVAWLENLAGPGEVVILSDFQRSSIDSTALARLPDEWGLSLQRIGTSTLPSIRSNISGRVWLAGSRVLSDAFLMRWESTPESQPAPLDLELITARTEHDAIRQGAATIPRSEPYPMGRRISLIRVDSLEQWQLNRRLLPPTSRWMADFLLALSTDQLLSGVTTATEDQPPATQEWPQILDQRGNPLLAAASDSEGSHLVLAISPGISGPEVALLLGAVRRHFTSAPRWQERLDNYWSDTELQRWQRQAGQRKLGDALAHQAGEAASDGRWFWLAVLLLLLLELPIRHRFRSREIVDAG